jgi:hypothetical protein
VVLTAMLCVACATERSLYDRMAAAVAPGDGLQQTQLAHIGHIETVEGSYEVCVQRLVVRGMRAPRGMHRLHLCSPRGKLIRSFRLLPSTTLLWCEGDRIYIFGYAAIDGIDPGPELARQFPPDVVPTGNVIDFSGGVRQAVLRRERCYGSSGGVDDGVDVR